MSHFRVERIKRMAEEELRKERFLDAVKKEKEKIKTRRKYWFPWRIRIVNLNRI